MRPDARRDLNLIVFLSNRCNLQCHYCAVEVNKGKALRLDESQLRAGIKTYLDEAEGRKGVTLLGGEPFLDFPLIERVADFLREESARRGEEVRLAVYTNGTLLSPERLASLRSRGATVWLSLDGKGDSNDAHRTFRSGGRSVFAQVEKRLAGVDTRQMRANMVVHADTARDLVRNAAWFHRRGFPLVNFHPELWEGWTPQRLRELEGSLLDFGRWYRARWSALGRPPFELPIISLVLDHTPKAEPSPWWEKCENLVLGADGRFRACERDVADDYELTEHKVIGDPANGIDWEKKESQYEEARALLRRRGAAKDWHHACPKGLVTLAAQRGWDPDRVLDSFQSVSKMFGEGITDLASSLIDLPGCREMYPGAIALKPSRLKAVLPSALDKFLDSAASPEAAAAHGLGAAAITRFWESESRDMKGLARLWRRFDGPARGKRPAAPKDEASKLVLRGLKLFKADGVPGRPGPESLMAWTAALEADPLCAWASFLLGISSMQERRLDEALERLTFAAELRPQWAWVRIVRAWTYHLLGRQDEARADLDAAARLSPRSAWPDALRGSAEYGGEPEAMLRHLSKAAKRRPAAWTIAWRGYARLRLGRSAEAAIDLKRALKLDPSFDRAWAWLGEAEGEDAPLSRAIALSPTMPTAFLARARARLARGDARGALADLAGMARLNRAYEWETNWYNARYLHEEREWGGLFAALASARAVAPADALLSLIEGAARLARREYAAAEAHLGAAAEGRLSVEWRPWAALWHGLALRRLGRASQAAAALSAAGGAAAAWSGAALSALDLSAGRFGAALTKAEAAARLDPRLSDAWLALASARLAAGDEAGSLDALDEHSALEPMMSWSREWRGRLAARLGRWHAASDALAGLAHAGPAAAALRSAAVARAFAAGSLPAAPDAALEASLPEPDLSWVFDDAPPPSLPNADARLPKEPGPFLARGRAALARGEFETALSQARWIVDEPIYSPWSSEGLLLEARSLAGLGRTAEASARLAFLARLLPASPWPHVLAARVLSGEGDAAGARRRLGLALRAAPSDARLRAGAAALLDREPALRGAP
jgi:sulfatase maturation enzyme AslB (radical SAM superfamily)/tetratricopeptide (TPR) repeat protein